MFLKSNWVILLANLLVSTMGFNLKLFYVYSIQCQESVHGHMDVTAQVFNYLFFYYLYIFVWRSCTDGSIFLKFTYIYINKQDNKLLTNPPLLCILIQEKGLALCPGGADETTRTKQHFLSHSYVHQC